MVASWPPTSGASRIWVERTTPAMGAGGSGRKRTYPPPTAAARMSPSTTTRRRALAMGLPPFHHSRRNRGEREIRERKYPQPQPVVRHLPEARAQLADADDAIDREI